MNKINITQCKINDFITNEAVNTLRANFLSIGVTSAAFTSFSRHSGTTSVSLHLAAALAAAGKRTLFIEADLRTGDLASKLGVTDEGAAGLSEYLCGKADFDSVVNETDSDRLSVLFAGGAVSNPSELLTFDVYEKLISRAKESFEYIIVDTPPIGQVSDCAVACRALDGAILVINAKNNSFKLERHAKAQIEAVGSRLLGAVLNRADYKDKSEYYGKAYSRKYGYKQR